MSPTMERTDLIAAIHAAITASAGSIGISATIAADLAHQVEDRLRITVSGGDLRYIGKIDRVARAHTLRQKFDGTNLKALAAELDITERRARQILYGK